MPEHPVKYNNKLEMLNLLKNMVPITCVIDVGVYSGTKELMITFPEIKHLLFELNPLFFNQIEQNYCGFDYKLYKFGLSSQSKDIFGVSLSNKKDGTVSHTQIQEKAPTVDGKFVIGYSILELRKFTDVSIDYEKDFFLKIDVDGHDLEVVKGFEDLINDASVIQIEATYKRIASTINILSNKGYRLISLVDQMYYGPSFWQADLIFVRNDLLDDNLAPDIHQDFNNQLFRCMS